MLYCSVQTCKNGTYTKMCQGFSAFKLPKSIQAREEWLKFAGVEETSNFRICAEHFDKKCFKTFHPRPLLKLDAIPTLRKGKQITAGQSRKISSETEIRTLNIDATDSNTTSIATATIGTQTNVKQSDSTSEQLDISKMPASMLNGENVTEQVELICNKVRNITISGKAFKTFTLYDLGECTLKIQFER